MLVNFSPNFQSQYKNQNFNTKKIDRMSFQKFSSEELKEITASHKSVDIFQAELIQQGRKLVSEEIEQLKALVIKMIKEDKLYIAETLKDIITT
jgi:hypothetical protein